MGMNAGTCRNLAVAGIVCGGVSLFIGGSLLSAVGFALGLAANLGIRKKASAASSDEAARSAYRLSRIALIASGLALVLNMLAAFVLMPVMLEQLESMGIDVGSLGFGEGSGSGDASGTGSGAGGIFS